MTSDSVFDLRHIGFEGKRSPGPSRRAGSVCAPGIAAAEPGLLPAPDRPDPFCRWVLGQAGLDASRYRGTPLQRRVPACLRTLRVRSVPEARERIRQHPHLVAAAANSLLIGVTEFWRDHYVFDGLQRAVVPALARRPSPIRIWSAGCSSGEELYSVAILLADARLLERSELLGTDCRPDAIEQAAASAYRAPQLATLPVQARRRYFEPASDGALQPIPVLRARVRWKVADVFRGVERGPWDVVLWRNAAIYLDSESAAGLFSRLIAVLSPGGFLVVGKAERPPASPHLAPVWRCIYRKDGEPHGRQ